MAEDPAAKEKRRKWTEEQNRKNREAAARREAAGQVPDSSGVEGMSTEELRRLSGRQQETGETVGEAVKELREEAPAFERAAETVPEAPRPEAPRPPPTPPPAPEESYIAQTGKYEFEFFTPEGQKERIQNVYDVLRISMNPFSPDLVRANISNPALKKGVELFAKHPYEAALMATGIAQAAKMITGYTSIGNSIMAGDILKGKAGKAALGFTTEYALAKGAPAAAKIAINPATAKVRAGLLTKAVQYGFKHKTFVLGTLATWVFSGTFAGNELGDAYMMLSIGMGDAVKRGDTKLVREYKEYIDDINEKNLLKYIPWLGPIAYVGAIGEKIRASQWKAEKDIKLAEEDHAKAVADEEIGQRIRAGLATEAEIEQYIKDNPYSDIAAIAKKEAVREAEAPYTDLIYGKVDPTTGLYMPSPTEMAKRRWNDEYYGRDGGVAQQWEPPSSFRFGLLHTAGGYEATGAGTKGEGQTYEVTGDIDPDQIAQYLYGVPYAQLTDEQKAVVDKW